MAKQSKSVQGKKSNWSTRLLKSSLEKKMGVQMIGMSSESFRQSLVLQIIPDGNFALGQASHTYLGKNKGLLINTMSVNYKNLALL